VYVRTWYRRGGWFGRAQRSGRAQISVPGVQADVTVEDIGPGPVDLRARVDAAYWRKYERYGSSSVEQMASDLAAQTTLRLTPERSR
jgi:hypothetical protein